MARKSKRLLKTSFSWNKLLHSRRSMSALVMVVLIVLGLISPEVRDNVADVLNIMMPGIADTGQPLPSTKPGPIKEGIWQVDRIVDGDTLYIGDEHGTYCVRLIGADTPETVKPNTPVQPFGPEASEFTKQKIAETENRVRIAFDGNQVDRYGRSLAMVYLPIPQGGELWLNELLIREGLARAQLQYRFSKSAKAVFQQAEDEAKRERRNIWSVP